MADRTFLRSSLPWLPVALALVAGCAESTTPSDSGTPGADAGEADGGPPIETDSGPPIETDSGPPIETDAQVDPDGGGPLDAGPPATCDTPGAIETVACGMCGTVERFCTAGGTWAYGECEGEGGECMPGTTDSIPCGDCGTQAARCSATCTWETTGACTGEGECTPGDRTRSGDGCPAGQTREVLCSDACAFEPATMCAADGCPTPGVIEDVPCGMCGTQERFCNVSRVWEYGACESEGLCMPGTTSTRPCGMCGTQAVRCDAMCGYVASGMCTGEGVCAPGTTQRTSMGCPAGQTRVVQCDAACGYSIVVEPCTTSRPVDVTLLLDVTGSNQASLDGDTATLQSRCVAPLLALRDVNVGVSYAGEFPVSPYGNTGDRPFQGGVEPQTTAATINTAISGHPDFYGNDAEDSVVEALSMLAGGPVAMSATALTCSSGRVAGGCWRTGATRVIVIHTDSPIHNGPDPATAALLAPYMGITPVPATWPEVRTRLMSSGTIVIFLDSMSYSPAPPQFDEMLTDLGQPLTDRHLAEGATAVGTACDAIVARVRTLAGL